MQGYDEAPPYLTGARYNRADALEQQHRYELVLVDYDEIVRTQVADARAWNRCWMRAIVGRLQSALADCNQSLRLNPNSANALDRRGLIHLQLDELDLSIGDYDVALRINPQLAPHCMVWDGKAKEG
jgi:tetratricopeptide (TPR) repeat protein